LLQYLDVYERQFCTDFCLSTAVRATEKEFSAASSGFHTRERSVLNLWEFGGSEKNFTTHGESRWERTGGQTTRVPVSRLDGRGAVWERLHGLREYRRQAYIPVRRGVRDAEPLQVPVSGRDAKRDTVHARGRHVERPV
jgi:hypothetical protein